jgi:hypothetical protein
MMSDYWVKVEHEGVMKDDDGYAAVLFKAEGCEGDGTRTQQVWIPRSQLKDWDEDEMIIPQWLADDRGLDWEYC